MSQFVTTRTKTIRAGAAIAMHLRVKFNAGLLALAGLGAADDDVGTMEVAALAANAPATVVLRNAQGTVPMVASAAITQGAAIYGAANGKVAVAVSGAILGYAMEAAAADGDVIEVMRVN